MIISAKNKRKCKLELVSYCYIQRLGSIGRNGLKYAFTQTGKWGGCE
jgi:hypothetical protein